MDLEREEERKLDGREREHAAGEAEGKREKAERERHYEERLPVSANATLRESVREQVEETEPDL